MQSKSNESWGDIRSYQDAFLGVARPALPAASSRIANLYRDHQREHLLITPDDSMKRTHQSGLQASDRWAPPGADSRPRFAGWPPCFATNPQTFAHPNSELETDSSQKDRKLQARGLL